MDEPLSPAVIQALAAFDTCTIANAIESFELRLRNEGYCDSSIQCRLPALAPMVGYAVTLRVRTGNPPVAGGTYAERNDWWDRIERSPLPHIVVIEDSDRRPGVGAFVGEVHAAVLQALGCVGAVTNGAVRDLPDVERLGFRLFSGALSTSHAYVHVVEAGTPVTIGGLTISPGDLLHGDRHGLLRVPRQIAADLPAVAARMQRHDDEIVTYCRSQAFTKEGLRKLLQLSH